MNRPRADRQRKSQSRRSLLPRPEGLEARRMLDGSYQSLAASPFFQDWSQVDQIAANDNWSGVPGIIGYLGDGSTFTAGSDPRLATATALGTVKVGANLTDVATAAAGVAEFVLADPVVAIKGSGTANTPSLVLHLNTSGTAGARIQFDLRDVDGTANNTTQQVALQYRLGGVGPFLNVPGAYVQDATRGPGLSTLVTQVSAYLPWEADNAPEVQVRILTTNAPGTDEWVGIDNLSATATPVSPTGSFRFTTSEFRAIEGVVMAAVTIARVGGTSGPASVTLSVDNGGTAAVGMDFGAVPATIAFAEGEASKQVLIPILDDSLLEGPETLLLSLSSPSIGTGLAGQTTATLTLDDNAGTTVLLNELKVNPDGGTDAPHEFVEVRGLPGAPLSNLYLVAINGDLSVAAPGPLGVVNFAQDLSGFRIGNSGLLVVTAAGGGPFIPFGTTVVGNRFLQEQSNLSNNSVTFALVSSPAPILWGQDLDIDNDGKLDLPSGALILDTVGWSDGDVGDRVYSDARLTQRSGTPDAASRFEHDVNPGALSAWFNGDLSPSKVADPASLVYDPTKNSENLPPGLNLTPGVANAVNPSTNGAPVATADNITIPFGATLKLSGADGLLLNDLDPDGDPLALILEAPLDQASGSLEVGVDGSVRFVPNLGFSGPVTFAYRATDGRSTGDPVTVTLTVDLPPNLPPTLGLPTDQATDEDTAVSLGQATSNALTLADPDAQLDPLQLTISAGSGTFSLSTLAGLTFSQGDGTADPTMTFTGGLIALNAALDGLVFAPALNMNGDVNVSVSLNDLGHNGSGGALTATGSFKINVVARNDAPVGVDDVAELDEDGSVEIDVLGNDLDVDDVVRSLQIDVVRSPELGTVVKQGGKLLYTASPDVSGTETFIYEVTDASGAKAQAAVTVQIRPMNDAPVYAAIGEFVVAEGSVLVIPNVATDRDGDTLAYSLTPATLDGVKLESKPGEIHLTAGGGPSTISLEARATDPGGLSATRTIRVQVANVAPTVLPLADAAIDRGSLFTAEGRFTDPGADLWNASVDYGDGSGVQALGLNPDRSFALGHVYPGAGRFTVLVRVLDADGGVGQTSFVVTANATVPPTGLATTQATGRKKGTTALELGFTGDLDLATATDPGRYRLISAGKDGKFGTRDDRTVVVKSVTYDGLGKLVRILPRKPLKITRPGLRLSVTGLKDSRGRLVDGNGDGVPGGDLLVQFQKKGVTLLVR